MRGHGPAADSAERVGLLGDGAVSSTRNPRPIGLDSYQTPRKSIETLRDFILPHIHFGDSLLEP